MDTPETSPAATRDALLDAAAAVFAEVGFQSATIRDICQRAGANIAAVNYHFGDKQALYTEVLKRSHLLALAKYPPDLGLAPDATPEQRLHAFVRSFLLRIFDQGPHSCHGRLMAREMVEPTAALDTLANDVIRPMAERLRGILRELLGPKVREPQLSLCAMSVVSQVTFYHNCRHMIARVMPGIALDERSVDQLAAHITAFSLAGLHGYRAGGGGKSRVSGF